LCQAALDTKFFCHKDCSVIFGEKAMHLENYLKRENLSKARFALKLGVTREAVSAWCRGDYYHNLKNLVAIEKLTKGVVLPESFFVEEENEKGAA